MWCEWGDAVERMGLVLCCIQKGRRESLILLAEFLSKFLLYGLFCERAAALVSRQPFGLHPRQHLLDASHLAGRHGLSDGPRRHDTHAGGDFPLLVGSWIVVLPASPSTTGPRF